MTRGGDTQSNLEELIEKRCAQRLSMLSFFDMETNTTKKDPLKFGAADYLLTKIIAVGFVLVSAIVTIVSPIIDWASGKPLSMRLDGLNQGPAVTAKPGVTVQHDTHLLAQFSDASAGLWLANLAPAILFVICMAVVVWLLWKLLDDVRDGRPFTRRNVTRMRLIAITIIGGSILLFTVQGLVNGHLLSTALPDTVMLFANNSSASDLLIPGVGFLLAGLAEAFGRGVELENDVEGLV